MPGRIKVGVIMGGSSSEHDISLETGRNVIRSMPQEYEAVPIRLTRGDDWTCGGKTMNPEEALSHVDAVFIAMHGGYGEDGRMQALLERYGVPYTGSGPGASHLAMNKMTAKKIFEHFNIPVPRYEVVSFFEKGDLREAGERILASLPGPWVIKPVNQGSSIGVSIVHDPRDLIEIVAAALEMNDSALIEEYIEGREVTCGVLEGYPHAGIHPLPATEIRPKRGSAFFDYAAKYSPETEEITPAPISRGAQDLVQYLSKRAHGALGCRAYSRADFILAEADAYLLEVNTLPGLTAQSLFPKAARAAGLSFEELVRHLLSLAVNDN